VTDLDLRNDENRPSLTSSAVAEERQDVSSKNAITGGSDTGLFVPLASQYTGTNARILVEI